MVNLNNKFVFKMHFVHKGLTKNSMSRYIFKDFSPSDTATEAIGNLAGFIDGSMPFRQLLEGKIEAKLEKIELFCDGKQLFRIIGIEDRLEKTPALRVPWMMMDFDSVNRELFDALVQTFPEQKKIFRGKFLEDALGL